MPYEPTPENADRCARGEIRVRVFSGPWSRKLKPAELREYEASKARGYCIARYSSELHEAWSRWCEATQTPRILVSLGRKYATVGLDPIYMQHSLHGDAVAEIREMLLGHGLRRGDCHEGYVLCERVPRDIAEQIAATMWAIATTPRPIEQPAQNT